MPTCGHFQGSVEITSALVDVSFTLYNSPLHDQVKIIEITSQMSLLTIQVYQCCLRTMSVLAIIPGPPSCISVLQYSQSGNFLLMGSDTGIVQVTQCNTMGSPSTMHSWQRSVHDGQNGRVTGIVMSADDQYLLSVAEDMTFYIQVSPVQSPTLSQSHGQDLVH